jgi:hypothetical protein
MVKLLYSTTGGTLENKVEMTSTKDPETLSLLGRIRAYSVGLLIAFVFGGFAYQLYWQRNHNVQLYEFAARNPAPLVPTDCAMRRGLPDVDFVVASAKRYGESPGYVEACWYPVERFQSLFPEHANADEGAIRQKQFLKMRFHTREFVSKPPPLWMLVIFSIASLIAIFVVLMAMWGARFETDPETVPQQPAKIDPRGSRPTWQRSDRKWTDRATNCRPRRPMSH